MEETKTSYGEFALFYDQLMQDAPYDSWLAFLEQVLARHELMPRHISDLGCGTGTLSLALFEKGYKVTGVDLSEEMLAEAESKVEHHSPRLRFLCQDLRELRLPEACDVAISFCDSLNYIPDKQGLRDVFTRVKKSLKDGGLFVFDMHSLYKMREKLGNDVFYHVTDELSYIWQSRWEEEQKSLEYDITFFALEVEGEELYRRFHELHRQRGYEIEEVRELLSRAGFHTVEVYADFAWDVPTETSERIFFVAK